MMLTRQGLPALERTEGFDPMQIAKGAYLLCELDPKQDQEDGELHDQGTADVALDDDGIEEAQAIVEMVDELDKVLNTVTLVGTGSEVSLCVEVAKELCRQGIRSRVVSMPSVTLFLEQSLADRQALLGEGLTVTVEAGSSLPWAGVVGMNGLHVGVDQFGASAPIHDLAQKYGFTSAQIVKRILDRIGHS